MSLDKAIAHGKEKRKPYYDSRRFDLTCRNHGTCPWCEGNRLFKRRAAEKAAEEETMSGTNPGAWPDQEPNEPQMSQYIDDGKREAFAELDKTIPLYTAADLAKAREEGRREGGEIINKLRWVQDYDEYRDEPSYFVCAACGEEKTNPEKHLADCYIGKWVALHDAKEAGE